MGEANSLNVTIGKNVACARIARGMSQTDLARRIGLRQSSIAHLEAGRRAMSCTSLLRAAEALSVTSDYLLGLDANYFGSSPK